MFVVTNREVFPTKTGLNAFGSTPSCSGPLELRLAEAKKSRDRWKIDILPDQVTAAMAAESGLDVSGPEPVYTSRYVAAKLLARINPKLSGGRGKGRNFVLFVHGFNNDLKSALDRAWRFEKTYQVEVLVFSWPANGGGAKGVASYLSDKADAQASVGALGRVLGKLQSIMAEVHATHEQRVEELANRRHPDDDEAWRTFFTEQAEKSCPFTVNLVLHSMGNYLFKKMLETSVFRSAQPIFDNVVLVAADTNTADHAEWVENIAARRRVFVTLNEHDIALAASRLKMGERQKARLGHYVFELNASNASYVNFTDAAHVARSHAYFEGKPTRNPSVKAFFDAAFNGLAAEQALPYDAARNLYQVS
ncbi:alpha/beta hydrolase [Synoicihabitans lomoniglobus]|uniref:Alpha/beta hydrolase n=1 Tax=Synoicihabitans lomoniglobus TaxID=2909285 RepID=A0AAF0CHI0_9BACT|nr:alpha/beta hydrolase [Opitutaceae bacterium LMO-M01]WED64337.1 alpha/beta hydrolase [Opitutaceae bacterium LMO-M01]